MAAVRQVRAGGHVVGAVQIRGPTKAQASADTQ